MEIHRLLYVLPRHSWRQQERLCQVLHREWIASVHHFKFQIKKVYLIFADEEVEIERPFQGQELRLKGGMQENARGEGGDVPADSSGLG